MCSHLASWRDLGLGPLLDTVCKIIAGIKLKAAPKTGLNAWRVLAYLLLTTSTNDSLSLLTMIMNPERAKDLGDMMSKPLIGGTPWFEITRSNSTRRTSLTRCARLRCSSGS